jgi:hypothetical protein
MSTVKGRLATMLAVATLFGCSGAQQKLDASAKEAANMSSSSGTRVEYITDPSMNNINAVAVTIPEKWHFQGVLFQGGSLPSLPFFVFRASSPDGLSFGERLPRLGWIWGSGPKMPRKEPNYLQVQGPMSAQDFLKYLAGTLKVEYVEDVPFPADQVAAREKSAQAGDKDYNFFKVTNTPDQASAIVRYQNGTFTMKGFLETAVDCRQTDWRPTRVLGPSTIHQCDATVWYLVAPEDQYESVKGMWDTPGLGGKIIPEWNHAMLVRIQQWGQMVRQQQNQMMMAQLHAQQAQFEHDQAVRQQMHEEFMATLQRGTDMSMARAQASMNAQSTAASDWVDYALNQRTVMDPASGQLTKVSSSYSYTWRDSTGKYVYQTTDPNANPNSTMPGSWTKQQVVHGDGAH